MNTVAKGHGTGRNHARRRAGPLVAMLLCGAWTGAAQAATVHPLTVIRNVTVVDTRTGQSRAGMSVTLRNGRIERVAPTAEADAPGAKVIDGAGRYLVPGYADMHSHALQTGDLQRNMALMLAKGITGFRQMAGDPGLLARRASGEDLTPGDAPDVLQVPGLILQDGNTPDVAAAQAQVAAQKAQGADFIKSLIGDPDVLEATIEAARDVGLRVSGHLPELERPQDAARKGMASIEHLGGSVGLLLTASRDEEAIRAEIAGLPAPPAPTGPPPPESLARFLANPLAFAPPGEFERTARIVASFDPAKAGALAEVLRDEGTWQVPTLVRLRTIELGASDEYRDDPLIAAYATPEQLALWREVSGIFEARTTPSDRATLIELYAAHESITRVLAEAGVPMMAGSDYGGGWLLPGFSLHDEFELLAHAGLTPLQVLQSTTLNAAAYLGRSDEMGNVREGMLADLVLLRDDPLADVTNLDAIDAVFKSRFDEGVGSAAFYSRSDLRDLLRLADGSVPGDPSPVPVPGSAGLMLPAMAGLAAARRRRRAA